MAVGGLHSGPAQQPMLIMGYAVPELPETLNTAVRGASHLACETVGNAGQWE